VGCLPAWLKLSSVGEGGGGIHIVPTGDNYFGYCFRVPGFVNWTTEGCMCLWIQLCDVQMWWDCVVALIVNYLCTVLPA
jgi:hypothetical protein